MNQISVLDIRRFSPIFELDVGEVDLALAVLPPAGCGIGDSLNASLHRLHLKRLLMALVQLVSIDHKYTSMNARTYLRILHATTDDLLRRQAISPCVSGVIYKLLDGTILQRAADAELAIKLLGNAMLDLVLCSDVPFHGTIPLRTSARGRIELSLCGSTLCVPDIEVASELEAVIRGREIDIINRHGTSLGWLSFGCGVCPIASRAWFEPLMHIAHSPITLVRDDADLYALYPKQSNAIRQCLADDEASIFIDALNGLALVRRHWIDGYKEIIETVYRVLPLENDGTPDPRNESVHGLRGLVATAPRPSYFAAQMWVHESGHNRFSTILDLHDILLSNGELLFSPFVQRLRPPHALLHGIFSFIRDMEITRRLQGHVNEVPGYSMDRYFKKNLQRLCAAMDMARTHLRPTPDGARLLEGFERAIQELIQC